MKVIRGINQIRRYPKPVVALGVFDGVHLGHRKILKAAAVKARAIKGTGMALTFWPHPQKEASLYSLEHRLRLIEELGLDVCVVINFNKRFSRVSANAFLKDILVKRIGTKFVFVGRNFRFGRNAEGDIKTLESGSSIYNFRLKVFEVIRINNRPISSTLIRALIKKGDLDKAKKLLGRPVSILGTVIKGISLGKKLGVPTANLDPHHEVIPAKGVYAVRVTFKNKRLIGACYIGSRASFLAPSAHRPSHRKDNIEVHIFNLNKNIYGKYLEIQFCKKIRGAKEFSNTGSLVAQIKKDVLAIRRYFSFH